MYVMWGIVYKYVHRQPNSSYCVMHDILIPNDAGRVAMIDMIFSRQISAIFGYLESGISAVLFRFFHKVFWVGIVYICTYILYIYNTDTTIDIKKEKISKPHIPSPTPHPPPPPAETFSNSPLSLLDGWTQ